MLGLLLDVAYPAGADFAAHSEEGEGLAADAQVLLVPLAPLAAAHSLHPLQIARVQKGLRGPVTALLADVILPNVLVQAVGCA